jgi:class 3 adenylate cyclase/tetratricopeptide (TPR) repeat protein
MNADSRQAPLMPDDYAAKMRRARDSRAMHGERRVITMLFCDVSGSTAMAEKLDPEEWAEIMHEAFQFMVAPVYKYEGTVARLMGDAVLAFFGAPIAHEDDPQRAVHAGLEIVSGISSFAAEIKETYGLDFNVRVGINTGPVVVGEIGPDLDLEYTAMGDAVNLAARMEQTAVPGTVQIAENTFKLVEPFFELAPLGPIEVKGKDLPVRAYRVQRRAAVPGSLRGIAGLQSPLVGRDIEFGIMRDLVKTIQSSGPGQALVVVGEAGLGKSRLVQELRGYWLQTRSHTDDGWNHWNHMAAVSYESKRPYGMIKHQLRSSSDISDSDSIAQARDKLAHTISFFPSAVQERFNMLFAILLGIGGPHTELRPEGEDFRRELFSAVLDASRLRFNNQPTVMVADDIHWADPASIAELENQVQLITELPVLYIAVMRPEEDTPAWAMKERLAARYPDRFTEIALQPLGSRESADLVSRLLPVQDMPADVRQMILDRTDGNPFFIEELIRALLEEGALQEGDGVLHWNPQQSETELAIPVNVQALLAARIDRLERDVRDTLQLASVIGRNFYRRVLEKISSKADALDDHLHILQQAAMIDEAARLPELEYAFRHVLTRDAAYSTILRRRRRQYHKRVAEAFETLFPDRLEEEAHRLADHYAVALVLDKAQHYYTMAGDQAQRLSANSEAIDHYTRALEIALEAGTDEQLLRIYERLGRVYELDGRYDNAIDLYREMEDEADRRRYPALELQSLLAQATLHSTFTERYHPVRGRQLAHEALDLARELGDESAESKAYWNLALVGTFADSDPEQAVRYGEKAVAIARRNNFREELAYALHDLARPYAMSGRLSEGKQVLEEAAQLWRSLGRANMLADNRTSLAEYLHIGGEIRRSVEVAGEALAISRRLSSSWGIAYASGTLAPSLFELGLVDEALAACRESLDAALKANFAAPKVYVRAHMALGLARLGDLETPFEIQREMQEATRLLTLPAIVALADACRARLLILKGDVEGARQALPEISSGLDLARTEPVMFGLLMTTSTLIKLAREEYDEVLAEVEELIAMVAADGALLTLPELSLLRAQALSGLGRFQEAADVLNGAADQARAFEARTNLLPILAELLEVQRRLGRETAASELREEGRQIVDFIAAHIGDPALRRKFVATDAVRALQDAAG